MEHGTTVKLPEADRKYKDTIFRWLFSDRENLLSLYNAVTGKNYTDAKALDVVTLESAVYLGMKNDVAFLVDTRLYLCEHQSTYNPNIPLRNLFYIASEYQVLVKDRSLYSYWLSCLRRSFWCFITERSRSQTGRSCGCRRRMRTSRESRIWS